MTPQQESDLKTLEGLRLREKADEDNRRIAERFKGYLFWCSEGCGFVGMNHKCEQWSQITYVSPQLQEALQHK